MAGATDVLFAKSPAAFDRNLFRLSSELPYAGLMLKPSQARDFGPMRPYRGASASGCADARIGADRSGGWGAKHRENQRADLSVFMVWEATSTG